MSRCALALALFAGCAAPPHDRLRYDDLLLSGAARVDARPAQLAEAMCAQETHDVVTLAAGQSIEAEATIGSRPVLWLSGCAGEAHPAPSVHLHVTVEPLGAPGAALQRGMRVQRGRGWIERRIDLSGFAGRRVRLRVTMPPRMPAPFYLRGLYVRESYRPRGDEIARPRDPRPRHVLLVSIDTLRADALGAFGGHAATPNLDALARRGQIWTRYYSASHWTKPSHASMLTGYPPRVHGMTDDTSVMPAGLRTLAERFRDAGFRTAGLANNLWLDPRFGFDRGFDEYQQRDWSLRQAGRYAVGWMDTHRREPFFFFLHTFAVHSDFGLLPYESPGMRQAVVERRFGVKGYGCREQRCASGLLEGLDQGKVAPLPREAEILRFLYDSGVAAVDADLGRILHDLDELGMLDDMLIVVTADHGEQFGEHGGWSHTKPWEEVTRVPLIVKWPRDRFAGERREVPASAIDLAPTLAAACGLDGSGLVGTDLLHRRADRPIFIADGYQIVIQNGLKAYLGRPEAHLYDLAADPAEKVDLAASRPADLARLAGMLQQEEGRGAAIRLAADRRAHPGFATLTSEERAKLRALGY